MTGFADEGPSAAELREDRAAAAAGASDPASLTAWVDDAASHLLARQRFAPVEDLRQPHELGRTDLSQALQDHLAQAIHVVGDGSHAGLGCPPLSLPRAEIRTEHRHLLKVGLLEERGADAPVLLSGDEGLVLTGPHDTAAVRFADVRAAEVSDAGTYLLHAADGTSLLVDPGEWKRGDRLTALIQDNVPRECRVATSATPVAPPPPPRHRPSPAQRIVSLLVLAATIVAWTWVRQVSGQPSAGVALVGTALAVAVAAGPPRGRRRR